MLDYKIHGGSLGVLDLWLEPRQSVYVENGSMAYMSQGIEMETSTGGGIFSGIKRKFSGEGFFVTRFTNEGQGKSCLGLAGPHPGMIMPVDLSQLQDNRFYCQRRAFLCAQDSVDVSIAFTKKLGAGFFGGEGFILQKLSGQGLAFLHAGGTIIRKELLPGETMSVDTGCLLGFTSQVDYSITLVKGIITPLFAKEGLFLAKMTGPGEVLIQSLPFSRLANSVAAAVTKLPKRARQYGES